MSRYIDADRLLSVLNENKIPYNSDINYFICHAPTADVTSKDKADSWAIGRYNRYLDLTKLYEYFRSKKITELKFYDNDIVHEFKMVVRGEWKWTPTGQPYCSVCGDFPWEHNSSTRSFCGECGADMRETEVEE